MIRRKIYRVFLESVLERIKGSYNNDSFFKLYDKLNQGQLYDLYNLHKEETKRAIGLLYPVYLIKNSGYHEKEKDAALQIYWKAFNEVYTESKINWFNKNIELYPPNKDEKMNDYGKRILYNVHLNLEDLGQDDQGWYLLDDYCPGLEACEILKLDTQEICKIGFSEQYQALLNKVAEHYNEFNNINNGNKLKFNRNYDEIRSPSSKCKFCKERIEVV